jgi:hypothetical protein
MEYYYINFKDKEIQSWQDENSELDQHNKATGNSFATFQECKEFLHKLLKDNSIE